MPKMTRDHRYFVWRTACKCPKCGAERGYSPAEPGGILCRCSSYINPDAIETVYDKQGNIVRDKSGDAKWKPIKIPPGNCGYTEFFSTGYIHERVRENARWEVLDSDNKVKDGWTF